MKLVAQKLFISKFGTTISMLLSSRY